MTLYIFHSTNWLAPVSTQAGMFLNWSTREQSLDLAMVKNGLLQTLIEKLRYEYNSTTILTYESVQNTAM